MTLLLMAVPLLLVHGSHGLELLWCGRKKHDSRFNALSSEMVTLGILPETPDPEVAYFEVLPFPVYGTRLDGEYLTFPVWWEFSGRRSAGINVRDRSPRWDVLCAMRNGVKCAHVACQTGL